MMTSETRWKNLITKMGEPVDQFSFSSIIDAYNEPHRYYHNISHIQHCLQLFDSTSHLCQHPVELEFAIWLHDVVYNPQKHDNEDLSAKMSNNLLESLRCPEPTIHRINDLILATKKHAPSKNPDIQLLLDIDLSILGQQPHTFEVYEKSVRAEYKFVPLEVYRVGRRKVLKSFLERTRIFQTSHYFELFEKSARVNLRKSITALSS